jgi:LmbE family N-acetylglucosaminyl deacetylase
VTPADDERHVVAFGAHAGDVEFTCGAVLAKYARHGHRATIVHMTLGEAGHPRMAPDEYAEQRRREVAESAAVLGAGVRCLPYADGRLPATPETELAVCDLVRELRPDVVLTHWRGSLHQDHVLTHHIVTRAVLLARLEGVERERPPHAVGAVYFAENWEDPQDFIPELYVDVSDDFETWLAAADKHALFRGEVVPFPYRDYYRALAAVRGAESGCRYAAAFMPARPVERRALPFFP